MNLKDFLTSRDKPPELFWSLVLEPGWVQAGIWYINENKAEVISISPGAAWESDDELISACDAALSSSVQKLPDNYPEPEKTVFGVPSFWVNDGEIKEENLSKIKKICTELSLTPVGFVVLPEAIAHLYKSQEGSPLSAIIIGLSEEFLEVSVFSMGNLSGSTSVARSVSLVEDVAEGLTRFSGISQLPSRIIIYDGKEGEIDEAKQSLTTASWEDQKINFLHTPKVESFSVDQKVTATSLAGAAELGQVTSVASEELQETGEDDSVPGDVENVAESKEELTPQEMGFVVGRDVSSEESSEDVHSDPIAKTPPPTVQEFVQKGEFKVVKTADGVVSKFRNMLKKLPGIFSSNTAVPKTPINKKSLNTALIVLIIFLVLGGIFWWFYPKATVTIYVSPKDFNQDTKVSFSTNATSDAGSGTLPAQSLSVEVSGDKTKATTGTKLIGDRSKGTVEISNGNPNPINLAAGTFLDSSGGLKFETDNEASVSAQVLPGQPGTTTVDVTAADIGAQYNLASGEVFSVGNFSKSLVAATAKSDFSGGSSQQIAAVAKDDQTSLEKSLQDELNQEAQGQLEEKVDSDHFFVTDLPASKISSETFDHQVGDQAENLKLSLKLDVTGIAADKNSLLDFANGLLKDKVPGGYVLRNSQINFDFSYLGTENSLYNYDANISANFLPQVNTDSIINQIAGKTPGAAETYLTTIPGFTRAEVKVSPNLPSFLTTLPHVHKNITIDVAAEQ